MTSAYFQDYKLTEEEISAIKKCNLSLSIPIIIDNKLIGALNFGPKYSGKAYSDEDIDLLKSFALHSATVLENARLEIFEMKKKKIDEELNIAKKIQMDLLPKKGFANDWLEITGISKPAEIIGGDFYDIIEVNENKLLTVVAVIS